MGREAPTTVYFDPERYTKIKIIAVLEDRRITDLVHEAFDMLIATRQPIENKKIQSKR